MGLIVLDTTRRQMTVSHTVHDKKLKIGRRSVCTSIPPIKMKLTPCADNPLHRMQQFLVKKGWWSKEADEDLRARQKKDVLAALKRGEAKPKPALGNIFTDVYGDEKLPWHLEEQREEMGRMLKKYGDKWEGYVKELGKFKGKGGEFMH